MLAATYPRSLSRWNAAFGFIFLYFLTLSVDLINIDIGVFKLKLSHLIGFTTVAFLACFQKGIFLERRYFFCFLSIFASMLLSSLFSICFYRSFTYGIIFLFTAFSYFFIPINLMLRCDESKILKMYIASYLVIGSYAAMQFFGSMAGIILPFSVQQVIFVRGSAFAHEPSFYTLYAIPFVIFLNTKWLLTKVSKDRNKKTASLFFANLCLLVSTSTTAVLSYLVFFAVVMLFKMTPYNRSYFIGLRRKLLKFAAGIMLCFAACACVFFELFKKTFLKFLYFGITHESFQDRFKGIVSAVKVFFEYPFFGAGLGGVGPYVHREKFYPGFGEQIFDIDRILFAKYEPTNVLTELLGSLGLFGFVAFTIFFFLIWQGFRRVLKDRRILPTERIHLLSFFISMIVMLICLQVNQGLFRAYIWVHLGIGVGYAMKIRERVKERESE